MEMRISENADRGLAGEYTMKEESGDEVGSLELETRVDDDVFVFSWTDKYGTGRLKMLFSGDKRSFFGFWNAADEPPHLRLGRKQGLNSYSKCASMTILLIPARSFMPSFL